MIVQVLIRTIVSAPLVWGNLLPVALNRAEIAFIGRMLASGTSLVTFFSHSALWSYSAGIAWPQTFWIDFVFTASFAYSMLRVYVLESRHALV